MPRKVGVRELRQNLSRYLDVVKEGEQLVVTEHGREVARLIPSGSEAELYAGLAERYGATVPTKRLEDAIAEVAPSGLPDGTADRYLDESRRERI